MAIKHHAVLLCDYLIRADSGRFTLAGVFQNIQASQIPAAKDPVGVYVQFVGDAGDPYEIALLRPDGEESVLERGEVTPPKDLVESQQWSVTVVAVASVVFASPGVYAIVLRSGGAEIHRYQFGVLPPPSAKTSGPQEEGNP